MYVYVLVLLVYKLHENIEGEKKKKSHIHITICIRKMRIFNGTEELYSYVPMAMAMVFRGARISFSLFDDEIELIFIWHAMQCEPSPGWDAIFDLIWYGLF